MALTFTHTNAIQAALDQNWKEAIKINTALLKENEDHIDVLNRLGYAYLQHGNTSLAKKYFQKVLSIDQYNQIAVKNIKKLQSGKPQQLSGVVSKMSPLLFLEDPGKTKIIQCVNTAPDKILTHLMCGQEVFLKPKKYIVEVRDANDTYLAALPDDMSFKLIKYLEAGNTYHTIVKSVVKHVLTIFVRELKRGKKFAHQPSFISTTSYVPFSRGEAQDGESKPDMTATGEESEDSGDSNES